MRLLLSLLVLFSIQSIAKEKSKVEDVVEIDSIVVYGIRSGPSLWKVSNGENTLWILGTLSPLPKKMIWESLEVEMVINDSQAYILPPSVSADVGFFKGLSLAASAIGIKKNPDKRKLKEVVPADIYERWLVLKQKYLGNDRGIEKTRPIFASSKLFDKAIHKIGLTFNTKVEKKVRKLAKKNKLEFIHPNIKIDLNKPKAAIKKFKKTEISDLECFTKTLDRLEGDLNIMRLRANAWATGDILELKQLNTPNQNKSCVSAILNNDIAKDVGMENIQQKLRDIWLQKAIKALTENKSTLAILPISHLLGDKSYLDYLAVEGYTVVEPK